MTEQKNGLDVLASLEATINERAASRSGKSYTAKLLAGGTGVCAKKFGEESVEAILAAMEDDPAHLVAETADVLYHLLVMLRSRGVSLSQVMAELDRRTAQSGLEEKAARGREQGGRS